MLPLKSLHIKALQGVCFLNKSRNITLTRSAFKWTTWTRCKRTKSLSGRHKGWWHLASHLVATRQTEAHLSHPSTHFREQKRKERKFQEVSHLELMYSFMKRIRWHIGSQECHQFPKQSHQLNLHRSCYGVRSEGVGTCMGTRGFVWRCCKCWSADRQWCTR